MTCTVPFTNLRAMTVLETESRMNKVQVQNLYIAIVWGCAEILLSICYKPTDASTLPSTDLGNFLTSNH